MISRNFISGEMIIMDGLLSVIVPVYNVEMTLDRCMKSIVNQTYRNLEIILIDDGSTDGSRKLCKEWCRRDTRVILKSKKQNEGLAEARNTGMRMCHGEYIAFVDSDDYLEGDAYEQMISVMKHDGSDMVVCNFWNCKENAKKKVAAYRLDDCCKMDILEDYILEKLPTTAWCKTMKKSLMVSESGEMLCFPKGRRYEDTVVSFKQAMDADKISVIAKPLYYYIQNNNTITANSDIKDSEDILQNIVEIRQLTRGKVSNDLLACYICSLLIFALQLYYKSGKKDRILRKKIVNEINKEKKSMKFRTINKSLKRKKLIICKLGLTDVAVLKMEKKKNDRCFVSNIWSRRK